MLRSAHVRWLRDELSGLVAGGVLSEEAAGRLRAHYGEEDEAAGARVVVVLFGVLGAVLIGGGIILLLAHNWDELSRPVRAVLSVTPLAGSLGLAGWAVATDRGAGWREPTAALWTLSIGAAISLVSQTYNLPGDWTSLLTTWLLLALPVVYLLRSVTAALLFCLGTLNWVLARSFGPEDATWFWPMLALLAPWVALRLRKRPESAGSVALAWGLALTIVFGLLPSLEHLAEETWMPILVSGLVALWAAGNRLRPVGVSSALQVVGGGGLLAVLLILSFSEAWGWHDRSRAPVPPLELAAEWLVVALIVAAGVVLSIAAVRRRGSIEVAVAAGLPLVWIGWWLGRVDSPEWPAALVNLYLIALGVVLLIGGMRETSLARANLGAGVLGALTLVRFFDTDWTFLLRGAAFITVGLGFVLINVVLLRRRRAA